MSKKMGKIVLAISVAAFLLGGVTVASAESQWAAKHPRREQVNRRLNNQNRRIKNEVRSGQITKARGARLHREDRAIRREERGMAGANGGHITKGEQRSLNRQENKASRQIGQ